MSNYVLTLSGRVDCTNTLIIILVSLLVIFSFACLIAFVGAGVENLGGVISVVVTGVVFVSSLIFSIIYFNCYQVQTYTVSESILNDDEAKTELLKNYCVVNYPNTPDGQICLIKIEDIDLWQ